MSIGATGDAYVPSAGDLPAKAKPALESQALIKPGMTSSEYIHTLEARKQSLDAVKALAQGMPERDSVSWACASSQKVADKLNPQELAAAAAAQAWVKNPCDATRAAAAEAASKTDFKGPGGWAAQAAAWSQGSASAANASGVAYGAPAAPALAPAAVTGAILLAAGLSTRPAMSAPQKPVLQAQPVAVPRTGIPSIPPQEPSPVDQSKLSSSLQPFLDLGKETASGKNSFC